jgi:hypothetical protein
MGGTFVLVNSAAGPVIMLRAGDGGRMVGRFDVNEAGVVSGVRAEVLAKGEGKRSTPPTTRAVGTGEMLR